MQYLGFGSGADGAATLSGTDTPIDSSCSGTGGTKSLSATNASFASEKIVLIHQSRGTGVGNWELNIIDSYSVGTITTVFDLINTYTDSGASQAQVIQLPEYTSVDVTGTFTAKAWDGNVGGIIAFLCQGEVNVSGTITGTGKGFRGGSGTSGADSSTPTYAYCGEGTTGASTQQDSAMGNGGGAGKNNRGPFGGSGSGAGAGGGNGAAGTSGGTNGGTGGSTSGSADLVTMTFGGGGGAGGSDWPSSGNTGGAGGNGGAIIFIAAYAIYVTGSIVSSGAAGSSGSGPNTNNGGGGGGGGSIMFLVVSGVFGTSLVAAIAGLGGGHTLSGSDGAIGGVGRIAIQACSRTGSTDPAANEVIGGHDWCAVFGSIY